MILVWGLCFVYHIYIYSLFLNYRLVSQTWTFGQIIAVTVWAPSIVEFFYTDYGKSTKTDSNQTSFPADKGKPEGPEEASKYKYPPGLQVFRSTIRPSIGLANLEPFQRTSQESLPTGHDPLDENDQSNDIPLSAPKPDYQLLRPLHSHTV